MQQDLVTDLTWKYYELHVNYRRQTLSFSLSGSALMISAILFMLEKGFFSLASIASIVGIAIAVCFMLLDIVTMEKIRNSVSNLIEVVNSHPLSDDKKSGFRSVIKKAANADISVNKSLL